MWTKDTSTLPWAFLNGVVDAELRGRDGRDRRDDRRMRKGGERMGETPHDSRCGFACRPQVTTGHRSLRSLESSSGYPSCEEMEIVVTTSGDLGFKGSKRSQPCSFGGSVRAAIDRPGLPSCLIWSASRNSQIRVVGLRAARLENLVARSLPAYALALVQPRVPRGTGTGLRLRSIKDRPKIFGSLNLDYCG